MYMMAPLDEHYDDGFGALGEAFRKAAETLKKVDGDERFFLNHLPESFLLRHATELYLKSGIIIIHRRLRLPYDAEPHTSTDPKFVHSSGKWKRLFGTHNLAELYGYWKKLIVEHEDRLEELTSHQADLTIPDELDGWINTLNLLDPSGDYLRYPISRNTDADKEKSPFKEVAPESLFSADRNDKEYSKALFVENVSGELVTVFKHDSATHKDVDEAAWNAAETLNGFHAMMRFEFTDGW